MFEQIGLSRMAQSLASYSGARLSVIANNIANSDTPGYRARDLVGFAATYEAMPGLEMRATRAGHLQLAQGFSSPESRPSGGSMSPNGNDVSLDLQVMKSVETRQNHEMALAVYRSAASILRTSLGRFG